MRCWIIIQRAEQPRMEYASVRLACNVDSSDAGAINTDFTLPGAIGVNLSVGYIIMTLLRTLVCMRQCVYSHLVYKGLSGITNNNHWSSVYYVYACSKPTIFHSQFSQRLTMIVNNFQFSRCWK